MSLESARGRLERHQVAIYLVAIGVGLALGLTAAEAAALFELAITPVLAVVIYTTFLQVPLANLPGAMANIRFLGALLAANFLAVPLLVWALFQMVPPDPAVQLGVLLVLLTPCIDYVVVFTHLGRGDSRLVLAATPILLFAQIILLSAYLRLLLGPGAEELLRLGPFFEAFLSFIAAPLLLAWLTELWAKQKSTGRRFTDAMGWGPVPLMALALFLVVGAAAPKIENALGDLVGVVPVYIGYVVAAPVIGLITARLFSLDVAASRSLVFIASTRNSLVVLPLAFAAPVGGGLVAAAVVTQTLVELLAEPAYIRLVPLLVPSPSLAEGPCRRSLRIRGNDLD